MSDIVERLRHWASIRDGEFIPPELLEDTQMGKWGEALRQLHTEAAGEIERLRGEVVLVTQMAGFKEIIPESL